MVRWVVGSTLHGVDPFSYFSFQPVFHDWCNKGCGMCYPVCGMMHIKEPLLLIGNVFGDKNIWKNIWKTIHSGLIDIWDFNIIYQLIHQEIAVRKKLYHWRIVPTPECFECSDVDSVLHAFFYCAKKKCIKHVEPIFIKPFSDNFQLNVYLIVFGPTQKIGNMASKLGIFLWSKVIKTIWICRKLLEESKPCNEMDIFKNLVKQRIEMEHFVALENEGK